MEIFVNLNPPVMRIILTARARATSRPCPVFDLYLIGLLVGVEIGSRLQELIQSPLHMQAVHSEARERNDGTNKTATMHGKLVKSSVLSPLLKVKKMCK